MAANSAGGQLGSTVAKHYNQLEEKGLEARVESRIFYLRNFNNWIKSILIGNYIQKVKKNNEGDCSLCILDLCSGKGGDLLKWKKARVDHVICADIAETSVEQCKGRYEEMLNRAKTERYPSKNFTAEFIVADCSKESLREKYKNPDIRFDLVSCQFSFHYSFESYEQADMMLKNACGNLKPGGYFIGTTPNANELMRRLRESDDMSFGNEVYRISFQTEDKHNIPLFGAKYDFHLEGVVDCPEFLVHIPLMEKMAEKYGMKLVQVSPFADYFTQEINQGDGRGLIGRMQSLEPYPPEEDVSLMSKKDDAYKIAKERVHQLTLEQEESQQDFRRRAIKVGTLSQDEWEATTIYLVYVFQKVDGAPYSSQEGSAGNTEDEPSAKVPRT